MCRPAALTAPPPLCSPQPPPPPAALQPAVVLWEIVTGERPNRGKMRLPLVPDECPEEVAALILECLSEAPAERPSAAEILQRVRWGACCAPCSPVGGHLCLLAGDRLSAHGLRRRPPLPPGSHTACRLGG